MLQLAHHNLEINWRIGEIKMIRCPEEYSKQQRPKQRKSGQKKQKEKRSEKEVKREEAKDNRSK